MSCLPAPSTRTRVLGDQAERPDRDYILYWMTAARRLTYNFALDHAIAAGERMGKPVLVFEALRAGYEHASPRHHRFILDGMHANQQAADDADVRYIAYAEPRHGEGKSLLKTLAERACLVVADDWPCFFLPRMLESAVSQVDVCVHAIDGNGMLPTRATQKVWHTAFAFRRVLQRELPDHLGDVPEADPLPQAAQLGKATVAREVLERWPMASVDVLRGDAGWEEAFTLSGDTPPTEVKGGAEEGAYLVERFLDRRLSEYAEVRNHPDERATSELSPYLHYGHVGSHQLFHTLAERENWTAEKLANEAKGKRQGWWGMSESAEAFVDQFVTWREVGLNAATWMPEDYNNYGGLPDWARETLEQHESDKRPELYDLETLEAAETDDPIWNAAQKQLAREGVIHNYLRMIWGKRMVEWTKTAKEATERLVYLNDKYALDGRDPNSYSGIFWCYGRYDRPWGPERKIFGKVRYMSSANTKRKLRISEYLEKYGGHSQGDLFD